MKKNKSKHYLLFATLCGLGIIACVYYYFFTSLCSSHETQYLYIDADDNIDSVEYKLSKISTPHGCDAFKILARHTDYADHIKTGRYAITPDKGALMTFRHIKNGMQDPVNLTIPSVRTIGRLSAEIAKHLMLDSTEIATALTNEATCQKYGYDTTTIACMFIPNTYGVYWNVSLEKFLGRMKHENDNFWTAERTTKAKDLKLSKNDVITLASIVDEETANNAEKPMVAGMYYNRLMLRNAEYPNGMPLQADPTIKYAWKNFELRRIYHNLLNIDSPYNTYRYEGLPPGPIRIPSVAGIDAVLNLTHHKYLYMCAKEDFSGTHNFATTYKEHLINAAKYTAALNARGIK